MKSKTSCFNPTLYKKNMTHYWPLWGVYLAFLILAVPFTIWQNASSEWYYAEFDEISRMYEIVWNSVDTLIKPQFIFVFSLAMALAVFSYLYTARSANMMHSLPVDRKELFVTNYLSGLSFLVIPQIITFFITVLVCLANGITLIQYLFYAMLIQMGLGFFAYSMAVFVAMFTGQLLAMPAYFFIINYLYIGCVYLVTAIVHMLNYGVTDRWEPGKSSVLSPLYYLINNLRVSNVYDYTGENSIPIGMEFKGGYLVVIYTATAVVFIVAAYQFYKRRQIESAGDWVSVGFVKPVFRWGVAMCGGVLLSLWFTISIENSHEVNAYWCSVLCIIVTGFICFFAAEMLLNKNFKVFQKKRIKEWAGFTVVAVLFLTLFEVDAFGIEGKVPQEDEIDRMFIDMDYPMMISEEDIPRALEVHRNIVENKDEYREIGTGEEGYYYTTLRYYLKDGSSLERRYAIPITEPYLEDETSPAAQIIAWECEPENLKKNIFGFDYKENKYISGYVDVYDENLEGYDYRLSDEQQNAIVEAIMKDIDAGNYDTYYLYTLKKESQDTYYNNISLDYYNANGIYDNWEYFYNYPRYVQDTWGVATEEAEYAMSTTAGAYITFGPKAVYTVKALQEQGVVDDTWMLWTTEAFYEKEEQLEY